MATIQQHCRHSSALVPAAGCQQGHSQDLDSEGCLLQHLLGRCFHYSAHLQPRVHPRCRGQASCAAGCGAGTLHCESAGGLWPGPDMAAPDGVQLSASCCSKLQSRDAKQGTSLRVLVRLRGGAERLSSWVVAAAWQAWEQWSSMCWSCPFSSKVHSRLRNNSHESGTGLRTSAADVTLCLACCFLGAGHTQDAVCTV